MDSLEQRLSAQGLVLPQPPSPGGNYLPHRISGNLLYLAGVICIRNGEMTHTGQVGNTRSVEYGYEGARVCALNVLSSTKGALGSLDRVTQFLFLSGYVNAVGGFDASPQVINGASDLFAEIFGEKGKHARAAVAVAGLPKNSTVELQAVIEFA
jgi:enamine deaminase RidA (YjgF/YER057c/UK114 family)